MHPAIQNTLVRAPAEDSLHIHKKSSQGLNQLEPQRPARAGGKNLRRSPRSIVLSAADPLESPQPPPAVLPHRSRRAASRSAVARSADRTRAAVAPGEEEGADGRGQCARFLRRGSGPPPPPASRGSMPAVAGRGVSASAIGSAGDWSREGARSRDCGRGDLIAGEASAARVQIAGPPIGRNYLGLFAEDFRLVLGLV